MKNWALVMAVAVGAYVFSQAGSAPNPTSNHLTRAGINQRYL